MSKKPHITMAKVEGASSVVRAGYDLDTKTLAVEFTTGDTYHYDGVKLETYQGLLKAKSFGKHLQANVVGKYKHKKL